MPGGSIGRRPTIGRPPPSGCSATSTWTCRGPIRRWSRGPPISCRICPTRAAHNLYYWYYATQVMHNQPGPDWDTWNRKMRRLLIDTQSKDGCAAGSWDPDAPTQDQWGDIGGRLMMTSLCGLDARSVLSLSAAVQTRPGIRRAGNPRPAGSRRSRQRRVGRSANVDTNDVRNRRSLVSTDAPCRSNSWEPTAREAYAIRNSGSR